MNVLTDRQKIDHQIKQFITALKQSARSDGKPLSRKGPGFRVDKTMTISTPLETPSTPYRVRLVEISADRAAIVTKHYLAIDMLVLLQVTGQHAVPARVSSTLSTPPSFRPSEPSASRRRRSVSTTVHGAMARANPTPSSFGRLPGATGMRPLPL